MVAAKQDALVGEREAQMVRGVAGGVHGLETPAVAFDDFAVLDRDVGREIPVAAGLGADLAAPAAGMGARSRQVGAVTACLERRGGQGVVVMGVGDEDMRHRFALKALGEGVDMRVQSGAGGSITANLALADDIGAGAAKRERAGVFRHDPPQPGRDPLELSVFEGDVAAVRDIDSRSGVPARILTSLLDSRGGLS